MGKPKHISRFALCFTAAAVCLSSQITAFAAEKTGSWDAPSGTVIDQETFQMSLPTVYLHINGGTEEFEKVNSSKDHSYKASGSMDIVIPEGFEGYVDSDAEITGIEGAEIEYIRGRGNSTWTPGDEKNPYKIKLAKKANIFGMGKSKHWALLANIFDSSLSKDRMSAYVADQLGLDYTPMGYPVDVMLDDGNGGYVYLGSYLLMETVRVESSRVDISVPEADEIEEGDYFFSLAQSITSADHFMTQKGVHYENGDPSFDAEEDEKAGTEAQKEYIRGFVQDAEDAAMLGRVRDENEPSGWKEVKASDYIDYESAARYWLIQNFSSNRDSYKNGSTYFYKTADSDEEKGKMYSGPVWDCDLAYMNIYNTEGYSRTVPWMLSLMKDESFFNIVKTEWSREGGLRDQAVLLSKDGGLLDQYAEEIATSAAQDHLAHPAKYEDFDNIQDSVNELKTWIKARIEWCDGHLYELPDVIRTVTLKYGDGEYDFDRYVGMQDTQFMGSDIDYPKEGYFLAGWLDEDGNEVTLSDEMISEDRVFTAKYIPDSEVIRAKEIWFSDPHPAVDLEEEAFLCSYTVYPENAQDRNQIKWSSSDPAVVTVTEDGNLYEFKSTGTATITARLYNGKEFSYDITVYDDTVIPESIDVAEDSLELTVGERGQAAFRLYPENAKYDRLSFNMEMTEGENVIDIDNNGVISALAPGKAKVSVSAVSFVRTDSGMDIKTVTDSYEVVVKAPAQKEIKVSAVWNDGDNKDGIRPISAFITFFADGDFLKAAEVYADTDWKAVITAPDSAEITVNVFKTEVISGTDGEGTYSYEITGSADEGFVVTFTHTPEEDESSEDDSSENESSKDESSEDESSEAESSKDESSEAESSKNDTSKASEAPKDNNPKTGAAVSLFAVSLITAAAVTAVVKRREK
ncbi:Ig-like domain (group 2) [Ruminococcaceae bacterium FB2012]|nr:Ig-like domain (group 2) [Ruminococcaceae bacterium FB2012]